MLLPKKFCGQQLEENDDAMDFKDDDLILVKESSMVQEESCCQEEDKQEISTIRQKVLRMFGEKFPSGITVEIFDYVKERGSFYERRENRMAEEEIVEAQDKEHVCHFYVRKFGLKPILDDEKLISTAKEIVSDGTPTQRFRSFDF